MGGRAMNERYKNWSKTRRFEAAEQKVIVEGWTQTEAAKTFGVTRQQLSVRMKKARLKAAADIEEMKDEQVRKDLLKDDSGKNVLPPFPEFFNMYFGEWVCPDCGVHHEMPDFHLEISEAIRDPENRRVLVNIPPYHSKSTLISVWDTVYDICENPDSRTIIVSKSKDFAETFVRQIQEILTNHELYANSERNLIDDWGPFKPEGQATWNQSEFIVAGRTRAEKDPTVLALGFGSQIYGRRADKIKFDDVATLSNSTNPERVASMLEWIDKEALSRIGKSGKAIWVGTRVSPGDIYVPLGLRPGYKVIRYPALRDEEEKKVLWPEHFPYSQVMIHRSEMRPADFQLVYQNVDIPGLGASFTEEMMEAAKDWGRVQGHYDPTWRLIAGLDLAGANKHSGYTAFTLLGIDLQTGKRYLVDQVAVRAMKAPQMRDQIFNWTDKYPIFEWRVEENGVQSQIVQYNEEIVRYLAQRGVRIVPHQTSSNKWDAEFGVETIATLFHQNLISIPWGNNPTRMAFTPAIHEFMGFPMAQTSDRVMSWWFADLGLRDLLKRQHLPMFNDRMKVPNRIKKRRHIVDFNAREVRRVGIRDQHQGHMTASQAGFRRATVGQPMDHDKVPEYEPEPDEVPMNIDPQIWNPQE
jgi:hypothetical protein